MTEKPQQPVWFKSSYSGSPQAECLEGADKSNSIWVRDSKNPDGGHIVFSRAAWESFTVHLQKGQVFP
ncbi:DUF397 domain-containing protein [Streptomyces sp. NPDC053474]|uniref:DUF397 domain-containing protein n=1 Tax=Streptomyces sp. NPDC053474 TaxID=3365704 RepID=UPI0037D8BDB6